MHTLYSYIKKIKERIILFIFPINISKGRGACGVGYSARREEKLVPLGKKATPLLGKCEDIYPQYTLCTSFPPAQHELRNFFPIPHLDRSPHTWLCSAMLVCGEVSEPIEVGAETLDRISPFHVPLSRDASRLVGEFEAVEVVFKLHRIL